LELSASGSYSTEDLIHDIFFPRKSTTDDIDFHEHNMWLLDERLAFHSFACSDKPLNEVSDSASKDRPDILVFSEVDEDAIARNVSIIEFKKPQRKDFDEDPTKQALRYLRQIKENTVKLPNGRVLMTNSTTRFYCYAVCDINEKIKEFAENANFSELKGELGYYSYNSKLNAHIEVLAFDKILSDAKRRHKIFFQKLGII